MVFRGVLFRDFNATKALNLLTVNALWVRGVKKTHAAGNIGEKIYNDITIQRHRFVV